MGISGAMFGVTQGANLNDYLEYEIRDSLIKLHGGLYFMCIDVCACKYIYIYIRICAYIYMYIYVCICI